LLSVLCLSGPTFAQSSYDYDATVGGNSQSPEDLVCFWYQKYLDREADEPGMVGWAQLLRQGTPPANVLGAMLSSQEYYDRAGGTPEGFAHTVFLDITGREPTPRELDGMVRRFHFGAGGWERGALACDLLQRYPHALYPSLAPGPGRPGDRPEDRWQQHEWHEHEYRRPDWRYRP
jgi:hypothetical protein